MTAKCDMAGSIVTLRQTRVEILGGKEYPASTEEFDCPGCGDRVDPKKTNLWFLTTDEIYECQCGHSSTIEVAPVERDELKVDVAFDEQQIADLLIANTRHHPSAPALDCRATVRFESKLHNGDLTTAAVVTLRPVETTDNHE